MAKFLYPLFLLLGGAADEELARMVEYLKAENRILRSKLPKRVAVTPAERARLVKLGRKVGSGIKELVTIVTPRTFARWASDSVGCFDTIIEKLDEIARPGAACVAPSAHLLHARR